MPAVLIFCTCWKKHTAPTSTRPSAVATTAQSIPKRSCLYRSNTRLSSAFRRTADGNLPEEVPTTTRFQAACRPQERGRRRTGTTCPTTAKPAALTTGRPVSLCSRPRQAQRCPPRPISHARARSTPSRETPDPLEGLTAASARKLGRVGSVWQIHSGDPCRATALTAYSASSPTNADDRPQPTGRSSFLSETRQDFADISATNG